MILGLHRYPRSLEADLDRRDAGADLVFAPEVERDVPERRGRGAGRSRGARQRSRGREQAGSLRGVATVVTKLFALFGPTRAYFGEKDYEQLALVRRLAVDLSFAIEVVGLRRRCARSTALRSRVATFGSRPSNARCAGALPGTRRRTRPPRGGGLSGARRRRDAHADLAASHSARCVYAEVRDAISLESPGADARELRVLVAASFGDVRLIDNLAAHLSDRPGLTSIVIGRLDLATGDEDGCPSKRGRASDG
jgi:pantoate--beta-alanine ligase